MVGSNKQTAEQHIRHCIDDRPEGGEPQQRTWACPHYELHCALYVIITLHISVIDREKQLNYVYRMV